MGKYNIFSKIIILSFCVIGFTLITVQATTSTAQADQCATFDFSTNTLRIPCLNLGGTSYWLDLGLDVSDLSFEFISAGDYGMPGSATECATFDFETNTLQIPCLTLWGAHYCLDLNLVFFNPIRFVFAGADVTGANTVSRAWFGDYSTSLIPSAGIEFILTQSCTYVTGSYVTAEEGRSVNGVFSGRVVGNAITFTLKQTAPSCTGIFHGTGTVSDDTMEFTFTGSDCLGYHANGQGSAIGIWQR